MITFNRQREKQAEELLLTPREASARRDVMQVMRVWEEAPRDPAALQVWYQNAQQLEAELREQYTMIAQLQEAVDAFREVMPRGSGNGQLQEQMCYRLLLVRYGILAEVLWRQGLIRNVRETLEVLAKAT